MIKPWRVLTKRWRFRRRRWSAPHLAQLPHHELYVAYLDLLGFARKVERDLSGDLETYDAIFSRIKEMSPGLLPTITIVVASDSVLLTSADLVEIIRACHFIQHFAIFHDTLIRGAITYGVHVQARGRKNLYVVSPALVKAVRLEKVVSRPCVMIDPAIEVPQSLYPRVGMHPLDRLLFFYDGYWIVSPFTRYWFQSAMTRVRLMIDDHPEQATKFKWLIGLCKAIEAGERLMPEISEASGGA